MNAVLSAPVGNMWGTMGEGMGLREKFAYAILMARGKVRTRAEERDNKLYVTGTVSSEVESEEIWNAIRTIPNWQERVVADIRVMPDPASSTFEAATPLPSRWPATWDE